MSADQYRDALHTLQPPGVALPSEAGSKWAVLLLALAAEFERVDSSGESLIDEADPRTTTQLLADWELVAGLPDVCAPETQTTTERRAALVAKLTNLGGQSRQFFIELAARLGYTVTITEFRPFRVGQNAAGDALHGDDWIFAWRVNAPSGVVREFEVGQSAAGDPLRSWGDSMLECAVVQRKPAQTQVFFAYQ